MGLRRLFQTEEVKKVIGVFDPRIKHEVLRIIAQNYDDFGPTLIAEKLLKRYQIKVSKETVRQWMNEVNIWIPKQKKRNILRTQKHFSGIINSCLANVR